MPGKYKVNPDDLKQIYAIADLQMRGTFHNLYTSYGLERQRNGNFVCPVEEGHLNGKDATASASIDNVTGVGHCFTCGYRFNFQKFWKERVAGTMSDQNDGSYTSWLIDNLGLHNLPNIRINGVSSLSDQDKENLEAMKSRSHGLNELYQSLLKHFKEENGGQDPVISKTTQKLIKEIDSIPVSIIDKAVQELLDDNEVTEYLFKERMISKEVIEKYRIGLETINGGSIRRILFPQFDGTGTLMNIKAYQPWAPQYKWSFPFKGRKARPSPIVNFTHSKLYFFEGEPDCYCAIGFGIDGAITMGSINNINIEEAFGSECGSLFRGKEIVICLDGDTEGKTAANALARMLYQYAKQIKIIDLNQSTINPRGLDPELKKEVEDEKGNKKSKRLEKDFTDFMKKNGFNNNALEIFLKLEEDTIVYTQNDNRTEEKEFHVTIMEARSPRYASTSGKVKLILTASVTDVDYNAYQMPSQINATCMKMTNAEFDQNMCKFCRLKDYPGFNVSSDVTLDITTDRNAQNMADPQKVAVTYHQLLGLIEVSENQKERNMKKYCGIPDKCSVCTLMGCGIPTSLIKVRLGRDLNEHTKSGAADVSMDGYMMNKDIMPNRSYRFKCTQTTSWSGQYAVLYIEDAEPILTSIDLFEMNDDIDEVLSVFSCKKGESVADHLSRRYEVFGNMAGINGRDRMFLTNDLCYFSTIEIKNQKILPEVTRGWVEVLIAGDSRCGKTVVTKFLSDHYKSGDFVGGASGITPSGLVGGISFFNKQPKISWGKFPVNDGGLVIIDEMSNMSVKTLVDLNDLRSRGIAQIDKIKAAATPSRVRKIFLSNARDDSGDQYEENEDNKTGIQMIKYLCGRPAVLSRFDFVHIVKATDVATDKFKFNYSHNHTEFTEYQCQKLIQWAYSRESDDIVFENGIEEYVNQMNVKLNEIYHPSTQLINVEMRAKIVRLSISLAMMLYSTAPGDYTKVYVKKEHAEYIVNVIIDEYNSNNMGLDRYSNMIRRSESLGDMRFMMNILKYVDINTVMLYNEFNENDLGSIFSDYLNRTTNRELLMVNGISDTAPSPCGTFLEAQKRFVGLLLARNCIKKSRYKYVKTSQFNKWLEDRIKKGSDAETSNILEPVVNEQYLKITKVFSSVGEGNPKPDER